LSKSKVRVHNHLLGGGFGRRLEVDFITRAVQVAKQVTGPVQVLWSREEDIQHDMYRPCYYDRIAAGLDAQGKPIAWTHRVTGSSIIARVSSELFPKNLRVIRALGLGSVIATMKGLDTDAVEGAVEPPYALPNIRVEVAVSKQGDVRVRRVVCAVDCGTVVNPDIVKAQMESGIVFGITGALWGEITIKNGRVEQHNFSDYRVLRMSETPAIEVHLVKSAEAPGGVGEPGPSAVMPAVTAA